MNTPYDVISRTPHTLPPTIRIAPVDLIRRRFPATRV